MNVVYEKEEVPSDFREILIKQLYKKVNQNECGNY